MRRGPRRARAHALWIGVVFALLSGCMAQQRLTEDSRKRIESVAINRTVQKPPEMYYMAPGSAAGLMFGVAGGAIAAGTSAAPGKMLREHAESSGISIEKIVLEELESALQESRKWPLSAKPGPNVGTINVTIKQYGFSVATTLSSKVVPTIALKCEMVDHAGNVIWLANSNVSLLAGESISVADLRSNPALIENAWRKASRSLIRKMVEDL